jgi:hypothetical protein
MMMSPSRKGTFPHWLRPLFSLLVILLATGTFTSTFTLPYSLLCLYWSGEQRGGHTRATRGVGHFLLEATSGWLGQPPSFEFVESSSHRRWQYYVVYSLPGSRGLRDR